MRAAAIPFSKMTDRSLSGVFVKRFGLHGTGPLRSYAHRDDYYIIGIITAGSADVDIDFERKRVCAGDILVVSPWQIHRPVSGSSDVDGWIVALSPEYLTEEEASLVAEYCVAATPLHLHGDRVADIDSLCRMLGKHADNDTVIVALALAVKTLVLTSLESADSGAVARYKRITLRLRQLLDVNLSVEKRPSAYAGMLNISEIYLNEAVKGATGMSVGAYIRSRIIIEAKRRMVYTSKSAKEIAYELGYADYSYFSRLFTKSAGVSPADFRKNLK